MTTLLHNIDDTRAEIMRLESAPTFDAEAWTRVLADLESAGRVSGLADAKRRMETARENQPAPVAVETGFKYGMKLIFINDIMSDFCFKLQNGEKIWYSDMTTI